MLEIVVKDLFGREHIDGDGCGAKYNPEIHEQQDVKPLRMNVRVKKIVQEQGRNLPASLSADKQIEKDTEKGTESKGGTERNGERN